MELLSNLGLGAAVALSPVNVALCFAGCMLGTLIGDLVQPAMDPRVRDSST